MKEFKDSRKTRYTRMVLQGSLIELMKDNPVSKITVKEICENADINRTTFYAHFSDQYELLKTIEDETLSYAEEMLINILKTDVNESRKIIENILKYFEDNKNHIQSLMSERGDIDFQKKLISLIYKYCSKMPYEGNHISFKDNEYYFAFAVNGSVGLIQYWLKTGLQKSAEEIAGILCDMVFSI